MNLAFSLFQQEDGTGDGKADGRILDQALRGFALGRAEERPGSHVSTVL